MKYVAGQNETQNGGRLTNEQSFWALKKNDCCSLGFPHLCFAIVFVLGSDRLKVIFELQSLINPPELSRITTSELSILIELWSIPNKG